MVSFCVTGGAEMQATFNFCGKCGTKTNRSSTNSSISTGASPQKGTMPLEIFQSSKEKQQQSFFKSVKNKFYQQRTITVGLVERDDAGDLKYIRGKRLQVKVSDKCSAAELRKAAIEKHSKYDQEFCALEDYVLLYPDFKEVFYLPRSLNVFQLDKYKHDLAKPYSQILFYLCMLLHFEKGQQSLGKINLSPKKPELPSTKEGNDSLLFEFSNFYRSLETIDLSIPSSNCSVFSIRN